MNIHNLVVSVIAVTIGLSACAAPQQDSNNMSTPITYQSFPAPTAHGTPINYGCTPLMDANWEGVTPPLEVIEARALTWDVATIKVDELFVSYYRDCSAGVRGPVSDRFPLGPYLGHIACNGDETMNLFGYPELRDDKEYTQSMIDHATSLINQLRQSDVCVTHVITPVS